jgi:hypothetical protein
MRYCTGLCRIELGEVGESARFSEIAFRGG